MSVFMELPARTGVDNKGLIIKRKQFSTFILESGDENVNTFAAAPDEF